MAEAAPFRSLPTSRPPPPSMAGCTRSGGRARAPSSTTPAATRGARSVNAVLARGDPAVAVIAGKIYVAGGTGSDMVGNGSKSTTQVRTRGRCWPQRLYPATTLPAARSEAGSTSSGDGAVPMPRRRMRSTIRQQTSGPGGRRCRPAAPASRPASSARASLRVRRGTCPALRRGRGLRSGHGYVAVAAAHARCSSRHLCRRDRSVIYLRAVQPSRVWARPARTRRSARGDPIPVGPFPRPRDSRPSARSERCRGNHFSSGGLTLFRGRDLSSDREGERLPAAKAFSWGIATTALSQEELMAEVDGEP